MPDEIEKSEPSPDDVLAAIQSFNDPNIIINLFRQLGWSYSVEIKETITLAQQNANMSIKFKAIKYLRELLREAAESAGYIANVSSTAPNAQGGMTTFHAKRIAGILNPVKKIKSTEIKESKDDKKEIRTEPNRGSDRGQSQDTQDAFPSPAGCPGAAVDPERNAESGGTEPPDGGETPRPVPRGGGSTSDSKGCSGQLRGQSKDGTESPSSSVSKKDSPCITTRPPTCNQDLFPGISSAEEG